MRNLTREQAQTRASLLKVDRYDVRLDTTTGPEVFDSSVTVRFACREPGASSFVEFAGEVIEARLNGVPLGPAVGNRLALADLAADNELAVLGRGTYSRTGEGLHRFVDPADGAVYVWGQSFLDDAQRIFACFDQPDLKAVFALTVVADPGTTVVANAAPLGDGRFAETARISPYLFTVAVGPWHSVRRTVEGIDYGVHCRASLAPALEADEIFELTARCMAFQQRAFGRPYPFGPSYDQLFVPEFNHGAMENPGAVTFTEDFVFRSRVTASAHRRRAMVIAHEMAHMWFGDLVTMRWWDDLWLNESFAELMGYLTCDRATDFPGTWEDFSASRKAWGYRADQLPSTHPVQGDVPDNRSALLNFDGISYAKGASVLLQLMATLGEDVFLTGVRAYLDRHAWGNTSFADLLAELEAAAGRDLGDWTRLWLQTTGVSTLRVVDGAVLQEGPVLRPHHLRIGVYDLADDVLVARAPIEVDLLESVDVPSADLVLPNDGDLTFVKVRLDSRSLATALSCVRLLPSALSRAIVWGSLWDTCRDAELAAGVFVQAVLDNVDGEADPALVEALLGQALVAATAFSFDGAALRSALAEASWAAALRDPGSDLQLVRVRAAASALSLGGPLRGVLDGSAVPSGLVVDADLRWHLVQCLAALGELDDDAIDAELARDRTATGQRRALTARAARPTAEAKAAAWASLSGGELSNHESAAVTAGFWRFGQDAVLRPYVSRYVTELPDLWEARSPAVAGDLAKGLFPATLVEQAVLDATAALEDPVLPAGLRRFVSEQRHDLTRALRARSA